MQEQATPSHKDAEPKDIRPKSEARDQETKESQTTHSSQPALPNQTDHAQQHDQKKKRKSSSPGTSNIFILAEALAGTALAFVVQFFQLRSKKKE
jgi:hypothetical protein